MGHSKWRPQKLGQAMDIERLNINVGGQRSQGFKGDGSEFAQISSLTKAALPPEYLNFILVADGGHPEIGCFRLPGDGDENLFDVDWFYSVGNSALERVQDVIPEWRSILGERTLPIGRDGGGNQVYLDMNSVPASVWLLLHDNGMMKIKVAENFDDFIGSLIPDPDAI